MSVMARTSAESEICPQTIRTRHRSSVELGVGATMFFALLAILVAGFEPMQVPAATWADSLFPDPIHDLGTVARGTRIKHRFRLINSSDQEVHISDWQTKCGCTEVKVGARTIPPGTQTFVEATLDTTKFEGPKSSGLVLNFDRPTSASNDLNFRCVIRGDIQLNPGVVDFGTATRGKPAEQSMLLTYNGGQANWGVFGIETASPHLVVDAEEVPGSRSASSVQYKLTAKLQTTVPLGYFKDEISLKTNDPNTSLIPISVTANVQGAVVLSPAILTLGTFKPGQQVSREVLLRASAPFTVTAMTPTKGDVAASAPSTTPQALQKMTVSFKMPTEPGNYHFLMEFQTSLEKDPPLKLSAFGTVAP